MSYTGISTRESRLAELLQRAWFDLPAYKHGLMAEIREALDAKCKTNLAGKREPEELCKLPAGHSGQCNAEG